MSMSWGGSRPNSGNKGKLKGQRRSDLVIPISIKISQESAGILESVTNKSKFIDQLIKDSDPAPSQAQS